MRLADLQSTFQAGVLAGGEPDNAAILGSIRNSQRTDRATLFGVYVNAYRLRLAELLRTDFPALRALIGETAFDALAADYIAREPSRQRNGRWYATRLPDFMRESETWRKETGTIDLARFERALAAAFDAPEAQALAVDALAGIEPARRPLLVFSFHPSLVVLELTAGTLETHEAATAEADIPPASGGRQTIAVWRSKGDSAYRELDRDEFFALSEALAGRVFGDICRMTPFQKAEAIETALERGRRFLTGWFEEGLVVAFRFADDADRSSNVPSKT